MKQNIGICCLLILGILLGSCIDSKKNGKSPAQSAESGFQQVTVNNEYVLSLPKYMEQASGLNNEASLQYQNNTKATYTIVLSESKEGLEQLLVPKKGDNTDVSLISQYGKMQLRLLNESMKIKRKNTPSSLNINGMDAEMLEIEGAVPGVENDIFYLLTIIEGKSKIYMVMSWTLSDNKQVYSNTFDQIAKSFELMN
ncbi:hypothetical protein [Flagellimonas meishanensis]|uniref:hypothetical protein n=1 Tax=Flagellimonas meishanensis TaxID=2873264 RepID=UPI001CA72BA1|nr:hypothetical protein [[Muricauda] meishanensis]